MTKETINVDGMTCNHCKMTVEQAAGKLDGVAKAKVDLKKNTLTVKFDEGKTSLDLIKDAVSEAGYQVV